MGISGLDIYTLLKGGQVSNPFDKTAVKEHVNLSRYVVPFPDGESLLQRLAEEFTAAGRGARTGSFSSSCLLRKLLLRE
jgi:hypothetical protein